MVSRPGRKASWSREFAEGGSRLCLAPRSGCRTPLSERSSVFSRGNCSLEKTLDLSDKGVRHPDRGAKQSLEPPSANSRDQDAFLPGRDTISGYPAHAC